MSDSVYHPKHYNHGRIEVIEYIEDQGWGLGFCMGNAVKYISRAGKKDATKTIEDLQKAEWYLRRAIETLQAKQENRAPVSPKDMPKPENDQPMPITELEKEAWQIVVNGRHQA